MLLFVIPSIRYPVDRNLLRELYGESRVQQRSGTQRRWYPQNCLTLLMKSTFSKAIQKFIIHYDTITKAGYVGIQCIASDVNPHHSTIFELCGKFQNVLTPVRISSPARKDGADRDIEILLAPFQPATDSFNNGSCCDRRKRTICREGSLQKVMRSVSHFRVNDSLLRLALAKFITDPLYGIHIASVISIIVILKISFNKIQIIILDTLKDNS